LFPQLALCLAIARKEIDVFLSPHGWNDDDDDDDDDDSV